MPLSVLPTWLPRVEECFLSPGYGTFLFLLILNNWTVLVRNSCHTPHQSWKRTLEIRLSKMYGQAIGSQGIGLVKARKTFIFLAVGMPHKCSTHSFNKFTLQSRIAFLRKLHRFRHVLTHCMWKGSSDNVHCKSMFKVAWTHMHCFTRLDQWSPNWSPLQRGNNPFAFC